MKIGQWVFALFLVLGFSASSLAGQGQWAGFLYLASDSPEPLTTEQKSELIQAFHRHGKNFHNDFHPNAKATDTIEYLRGVGYTLNGGKAPGPVPFALVRVESNDLDKLDEFLNAVTRDIGDRLLVDIRMGVTGALNYTDAETLARLKKEAPKRGNGNDQPNAVVFPLSKSSEWWGMPTDKRTALFFAHEDQFGAGHLGHNGVGFQYINKIFRKLYHARFIDPQQDFMTYFEFADADRDTFDSLLNGLRDTSKNQEWKYMKEGPIFWGKRVPGPEQLF